MIERQVIVTWYTPEEKLPAEDEGVIATVSGDVNGTLIFERAVLTVCYDKEEGMVFRGLQLHTSDRSCLVRFGSIRGLGGKNMMDLDEAIQSLVDEMEKQATLGHIGHVANLNQMVEWLRELKAYRELIPSFSEHWKEVEQ